MHPSNPFTGFPDVLMKRLAADTGGGYFPDGSIGRFEKDPRDGRYRPIRRPTGRERWRKYSRMSWR